MRIKSTRKRVRGLGFASFHGLGSSAHDGVQFAGLRLPLFALRPGCGFIPKAALAIHDPGCKVLPVRGFVVASPAIKNLAALSNGREPFAFASCPMRQIFDGLSRLSAKVLLVGSDEQFARDVVRVLARQDRQHHPQALGEELGVNRWQVRQWRVSHPLRFGQLLVVQTLRRIR